MAKSEGRVGVGFVMLLAKLGTKFGPLLLKLGKLLKFGKLGMALGTFGVYAYVLNWKFSLFFMISLFIHEMGHVQAMKRFGVAHGGINFIPFVGAIIVPDRNFPSRKAEAVIALMGPVWGGSLAVLAYGIYLATGSPLIAALAGFIAMLNLFNLLPVMPLDGGRAFHAATFSFHTSFGHATFVATTILGACVAIQFHLGLLGFMTALGAGEVMVAYVREQKMRERPWVIRSLALLLDVPPTGEAVSQKLLWLAEEIEPTTYANKAEFNERLARLPKSLIEAVNLINEKGEGMTMLRQHVALLTKIPIGSIPEIDAHLEPLWASCKAEYRFEEVATLAVNAASQAGMIAHRLEHKPKTKKDMQFSLFNWWVPRGEDKSTFLNNYLEGHKPPLSIMGAITTLLAYTAIVVVLGGIIVLVSHVPGADLALKAFEH